MSFPNGRRSIIITIRGVKTGDGTSGIPSYAKQVRVAEGRETTPSAAAFAHPSRGRAFFLLMPTVSIPAFNSALQHFATYVQADDNKQVLLLLDNAGWQFSPQVQAPPHIGFRFLPAYSPELQPAEHLWQLTDNPLMNRRCDSLEELEAILIDHYCWLQDQHSLIRSAALFHWWPTTA
ncbi:MAG: transposase [Chloroflexota bacterium]